jgi:hypothetical protein
MLYACSQVPSVWQQPYVSVMSHDDHWPSIGVGLRPTCVDEKDALAKSKCGACLAHHTAYTGCSTRCINVSHATDLGPDTQPRTKQQQRHPQGQGG